MCEGCIGGISSSFIGTALGAVRYTPAGGVVPTTAPTSVDWSDSVNTETSWADWPDSNLVPAIPVNAPTTVLDSVILVSRMAYLPPHVGFSITHVVGTELTSWSSGQFCRCSCWSFFLELRNLDQRESAI